MNIANLLQRQDIKNIHFIGIGGISMSGLAEILMNLGYAVTGSDMKSSNITRRLEGKGASIAYSHSRDNIKNPDLVVYTAAVREDNPERQRAAELGIPSIERAVLLGEIMKRYPFSIAVSGTHGKTTTTSMVTMIMLESGLDPTIHIGGELTAIGGNTLIGGDRYFIAEACEYVESFLKFHPFLAIVLNIELDHVDYFKDLDHIKNAFMKFAGQVDPAGYLVVCADDPNALGLLDGVDCHKITYGIKAADAQWSAGNITFDDGGCAVYNLLHFGRHTCEIKLGVPGLHNVSNSLGAIAACAALGCSLEDISRGLARFTGTHKRFEKKGSVDGIRVVDDYAHHPSEIKVTLKAAKAGIPNRLWCVFQPHTYTRTKAFMDDFAASFGDADRIIVTDIYAAREKDTGEVHASMLADRILSHGEDALYISGFQNIVNYLDENAKPGDLILTMGAGDISTVGELFLKLRKERSKG